MVPSMVMLPMPARSEMTEARAARRMGVVSRSTEKAKDVLKTSSNTSFILFPPLCR